MNDKKSKEEVLLGLSDAEVAKSAQEHGTNQLSKKEMESIWSMFLDAFKDPSVIVLCVSLLISLSVTIISQMIPALSGRGDYIELVSIVLAIVASTTITTRSAYKNQSRFNALHEEYSKTYAKTMRNGKLQNILTNDLVIGDIVLIQAGDKVPADGLVRKGKVKVSQAALNGESVDVTKEETDSDEDALTDNFDSRSKIFMGSVVTSGECYTETTVIGDASELGKINKSLTEDEDERKDTTSLKLEVLVGQIGKLGGFCAAVAAILQVVLGIMRAEEAVQVTQVILLVSDAIMLGASIMIMAIPEGLGVIVSLVQSMNSESMYKHNIMVSHNAAFADSAYVNILFSDKTGTITKGNLRISEFLLGNGQILKEYKDKERLSEAITYNNMAKISADKKASGSNNMDRALLDYAIENYGVESVDESRIKEMSGFDSEKKCATVEMMDGTVYWKGATESIINDITDYIDEDSRLQKFTAEHKNHLLNSMKMQAERTMKMLAVVEIKGSKKILMTVLCLRDDVRSDAVETVHILHNGGIQVVMVTGDAEDTAIAIAKEAKIIENDTDIVLTHDELAAMSDAELKEKLPNLRVVSRAKPLDKKRLVSVAQSLENVVGMTGDGVNDAPALKQADVGFAMGDGTAVAQEAGDVVILNNSLTSIKESILNSRTMAKSIAKFLIFQLTVNVSTLLMNILAPVLGWTEPFSIVQILWINLVMDCGAGIALAMEPVLARYMNEKPAHRNDKLLSPYIKSAVGTSAVFITFGSILILENAFGILDFVRPADCADVDLFDKTFMFAFFLYSVIFNGLNVRSENYNLFEHIGENKNFIYVMSGVFIVQTIILQVAGPIFRTTPLNARAFFVSLLLAVIIIPVDMVRKSIYKAMVKQN